MKIETFDVYDEVQIKLTEEEKKKIIDYIDNNTNVRWLNVVKIYIPKYSGVFSFLLYGSHCNLIKYNKISHILDL